MSQLYFTPDLEGRDLLFTQDFSTDELAQRRQRIAETIGHGSHFLIASAPPVRHNYQYQDATFYYFTGLEIPRCFVLIEGGTGRTQLFADSRSKMHGEEFNCLGFEDADLIKQRLKFDEVQSTEEMTASLQGVKTMYVMHSEPEGGGGDFFASLGNARERSEDPWDQYEPRHLRLIRLLKDRIPGVEIEDASMLVREMRSLKSPAEIDLMRKAGQLAGDACVEAMKASYAGVNENELRAIGDYVYRLRGGCRNSYGWIVAGGKRTWDGHYGLNNREIHDGEVVLMDCGPALRNYTSDIARLWPVNGTFGPWHRRIYGFIVEYHKALLAEIKPGVLPTDVYERAAKTMAGICTEPEHPYYDMKAIFEQMVERGVGYLNHGVGLSVHDPMGRWKDVPLREGFVVVCDPMVWCEPQREYIRVEDTLVVTKDGYEILTSTAPFEIEDIEALMRQSKTNTNSNTKV